MRKRIPSVWFCALVFLTALLWRIVGSPMDAEEWDGVRTQLWQAGVLLPQRATRIALNWQNIETFIETMDQETQTFSDAQEVWLNVYITDEDRLARMTLSGYVCGVIAEEMPAAYHTEALKAQAVAARTRAVSQRLNGGCSQYPGADICTESGHCQGYASLAECREKWGESYTIYRDRILNAEQETENAILTYQNKPIQVYYHAISGGQTEDAQTVFAQSLPYLVSVESCGEEKTRGYSTETTLSFDVLTEKLSDLCGQTLLPAQVHQTLSIGGYTNSGRVDTLDVAGFSVDAATFRKALGLRSTWFSMSMNDEGVTFHQRGYGHGVGMSQAGANVMASDGAGYEEILLHYYPGVVLKKE